MLHVQVQKEIFVEAEKHQQHDDYAVKCEHTDLNSCYFLHKRPKKVD